MKKLLAFLLCAVFALGLFAGCSGDDASSNGSNTDKTTSVSADMFSKETITFAENGSSKYRIVRPEDDATNAGAQYIFKQLKKITGSNVRTVSDKENGTDMYEIIVGNCDREETRLAKAYLEQKVAGRYNDFIVCTIGKKIVVYGQSIEANTEAAKYLIENYAKKGTVEGGIFHTHAETGDFESITVNGVEVGKFELVRTHTNFSYLTELEVQKLVESVLSKTGFKMDILHDTKTADRPAQYEVIIGDTTREGVEKITDYDTYKITVKGTRVYINGGSPHALALGVSEFNKMLKGQLKPPNGNSQHGQCKVHCRQHCIGGHSFGFVLHKKTPFAAVATKEVIH